MGVVYWSNRGTFVLLYLIAVKVRVTAQSILPLQIHRHPCDPHPQQPQLLIVLPRKCHVRYHEICRHTQYHGPIPIEHIHRIPARRHNQPVFRHLHAICIQTLNLIDRAFAGDIEIVDDIVGVDDAKAGVVVDDDVVADFSDDGIEEPAAPVSVWQRVVWSGENSMPLAIWRDSETMLTAPVEERKR